MFFLPVSSTAINTASTPQHEHVLKDHLNASFTERDVWTPHIDSPLIRQCNARLANNSAAGNVSPPTTTTTTCRQSHEAADDDDVNTPFLWRHRNQEDHHDDLSLCTVRLITTSTTTPTTDAQPSAPASRSQRRRWHRFENQTLPPYDQIAPPPDSADSADAARTNTIQTATSTTQQYSPQAATHYSPSDAERVSMKSTIKSSAAISTTKYSENITKQDIGRERNDDVGVGERAASQPPYPPPSTVCPSIEATTASDSIHSATVVKNRSTIAASSEFGLQSGNQNEVVGRIVADPTECRSRGNDTDAVAPGSSSGIMASSSEQRRQQNDDDNDGCRHRHDGSDDDDGNSFVGDGESLIKNQTFVQCVTRRRRSSARSIGSSQWRVIRLRSVIVVS